MRGMGSSGGIWRTCSATCDLRSASRAHHPFWLSGTLADEALWQCQHPLRHALLLDGPALDPAGDAAQGDAVAGVLLGAFRVGTHGADPLQPARPAGSSGCRWTRALGDPTVFTHNREQARRQADVARQFSGGADDSESGEAASVERALLGGRHAGRGLGKHEELPPKARLRRAARAGSATASATPQGEAVERDACLDAAFGSAALSQGRWPREPAVLHGACPRGAPQRAGDLRHANPCHRQGRARGDADAAQPARCPAPTSRSARRSARTT